MPTPAEWLQNRLASRADKSLTAAFGMSKLGADQAKNVAASLAQERQRLARADNSELPAGSPPSAGLNEPALTRADQPETANRAQQPSQEEQEEEPGGGLTGQQLNDLGNGMNTLRSDLGNDIKSQASTGKLKQDMSSNVEYAKEVIRNRLNVKKRLQNDIKNFKEDLRDNLQELTSLRSWGMRILRRIPGIGTMINMFEQYLNKDIQKAINLLEFIKRRLKNVESVLAEVDAVKHWRAIITIGIIPIIIIILAVILSPLLFIMLFVYAAIPTLFSPMARKVQSFIKTNIDPLLEKLNKKVRQQRRRLAAQVKTQQLNAAAEAEQQQAQVEASQIEAEAA